MVDGAESDSKAGGRGESKSESEPPGSGDAGAIKDTAAEDPGNQASSYGNDQVGKHHQRLSARDAPGALVNLRPLLYAAAAAWQSLKSGRNPPVLISHSRTVKFVFGPFKGSFRPAWL